MPLRRFARRNHLRRGLLTFGAVSIVLANGCRPSSTAVSGTVTLDKAPLSVQPNQHGKIVFQPAGGHGAVAVGVLDSAGHFELSTGSSNEVAPGEYEVAISVSEPLPQQENAERSAKLVTPIKYSSAADSGLEANVKPGENVFSFNLESRAGEANSSPPTSSAAPSETTGTPQSPK
jgi:hypothetical protein